MRGGYDADLTLTLLYCSKMVCSQQEDYLQMGLFEVSGLCVIVSVCFDQ